MKKLLLAVALASCAQHLARVRPGWKSCSAAGNVISCQGVEVARVECVEPYADTCGELAVSYAGGERAVLTREGALRPELAADGSRLWFREREIRSDLWNVYDPQSGVMQQVDPYAVFQLRAQGAVPLWKGGAR